MTDEKHADVRINGEPLSGEKLDALESAYGARPLPGHGPIGYGF